MLQWVAVAVLVTASLLLLPADSCNEAVCASVVSKCMLTQSCKCDLKNCSCCKECFSCLNHLYSECCSCVDMCPKSNDTGNILGRKSHVEDFSNSLALLFTALTSEPDPLERWVTFSFPVDNDVTRHYMKLHKELKYHTQNINIEEEAPAKDITTLNCTVAYISQCVSWNKCKMICHSMGSSSYRWFHDGCCECIGQTCINYGSSESRCPNCPISINDLLYEEDSDSYTYDNSREELILNEQTLK